MKLRRLGLRALFYLALAASLLVFPSAVPWMLAGWLFAWGWRRARGKPGWPPLVFALGIAAVKRLDWPPGLVVLGLVMIALAGLEALRREIDLRIATALLALAWGWAAVEWRLAERCGRRPALDDRPVVCIGDSLTAGGYPSHLARLLRVPVVDRAAAGIDTREGLDLFPGVLELRPQAVVIELGGHDYLQGRTRRQTKENLERMIRAARGSGAEVVLFEIPRGFITDPFAGLDRELARKHDLELVPDGAIRSLVLFSDLTPLGKFRKLSYDGLHPSDEGDAFLARRVEAALRRIYGGSIAR